MKISSVAIAAAEYLLPRTGCFGSSRLPQLAKFRNQSVLVPLEVIHQLFRHRPFESLVGRGRAVARIALESDFVLHLDHDDGVLPAIDFLHVPHERGEGARVGVARSRRSAA